MSPHTTHNSCPNSTDTPETRSFSVILPTPVGDVLITDNISNAHNANMICATLQNAIMESIGNEPEYMQYGPVSWGPHKTGRPFESIDPNKLDGAVRNAVKQLQAEFNI